MTGRASAAVVACLTRRVAAADVDEFRIDAMRHLRPEAGADLCHAVREYARRTGKTNFLLFGEVASGEREMLRYVGDNGPRGDEGDRARYPLLDTVLDFSLYNVLGGVLRGEKSPGLLRDRDEFRRGYFRDSGDAGRYYVAFFENHDQTARPGRRFLRGADPRLAGPAAAFLLGGAGVPCLYYGFEQGFDGGPPEGADGGDPYVRESMFGGPWGPFGSTADAHHFDPGHANYCLISRLATVRADQPALRYGRQYLRDVSTDGETFGLPDRASCTLAFSRVLDVDEVTVVANLSPEPREDWVNVGALLTPAGCAVADLMSPDGEPLRAERRGDRVPLGPFGVAVLKRR